MLATLAKVLTFGSRHILIAFKLRWPIVLYFVTASSKKSRSSPDMLSKLARVCAVRIDAPM